MPRRQNRRGVLLEKGEERLAGDHAVLDDLGQAGAELAVGERPQALGVDPDSARLIEGADQVLARG